MTTAFIITLTFLLIAFIAYILKKGELDAVKDDYNELEGLLAKKASTISEKEKAIAEKDSLLKKQDAAITNLNEKVQTLITEGDETINQFRSKVDELLVTNEGLKNEIAGRDRKVSDLQSKISDLQSKLKYAEGLHGEKEKELARYQAEAKDLRDEYDALQKVYNDLASRLVTVSREMPSSLVSSRKAERLSVSLRQYITETPEGASLQIVAPFHPADTSDEK